LLITFNVSKAYSKKHLTRADDPMYKFHIEVRCPVPVEPYVALHYAKR